MNSWLSKPNYGHCDVPLTGDYISVGKWCSGMRSSYKKIQNNQKPRMKLSNEKIQRFLNDVGFKWSLRGLRESSFFDKRFNEL